MPKYHNQKVRVGGILFDSQKEGRRYTELLLLARAGKITDLELQKEYELIPAQYEDVPTGDVYKKGERKGQTKIKRITVEKPVKYVADFVYKENGITVVEDTKGVRTKEYIIKRKLMLYLHNIKIKEL